ncbi:MAG: glutaredoxin family protein, partial [Phycicoccus sp.]
MEGVTAACASAGAGRPCSLTDADDAVSTAADDASAAVRVTLVTRADCHLCVVARETVARVAAELGVGWAEVDVDADPDLRRRWS